MQGLILMIFIQQRLMSSLLCQMAYMQGQLEQMTDDMESLRANIKALYGIRGGEYALDV